VSASEVSAVVKQLHGNTVTVRPKAFSVALTFVLVLLLAARATANDASDDAIAKVCDPACGIGLACVAGDCTSACAPACTTQERCIGPNQCARLSPERWGEAKVKEERTQHERDAYQPSVVRVYGGPMLFVAGSTFVVNPGGTVAVHVHVNTARTTFVGGRLTVVGGSFGTFFATLDCEFGFRPRLYARRGVAVGVVLASGLGFGTDGVDPLFHLAARIGPFFDVGPFTFELLGGPALTASGAIVGAFEPMFELGARF